MIDLDNKKIVVTFLMHLGDVILTTPFLEVLRKAAPHSHITYVMDKKLLDVMKYNPHIDRIITVDKKGEDNSISALRKIAKQIKCEVQPDVVINLHPNERTSYLVWKIGAPYTTGMSHFLFRPFMSKYTRLDRKTLHAADMYIDVLAQLGVKDLSNHGLYIKTCEEWENNVTSFYSAQGIDGTDKLIGFNVGSAVLEKRWDKENFARVADYFANKGYKIVFFGGPMDVEMVSDVTNQMKSTPIIGTGKFGLGELAAAVKRCCLFITNDSGPMHVAISQKVSIVALYGPSNPMFYGPYKANAVVLESMDHYEIGKSMKKVIREGKYKGLSVISVEKVIEGAEKLLEKVGI